MLDRIFFEALCEAEADVVCDDDLIDLDALRDMRQHLEKVDPLAAKHLRDELKRRLSG